MTHTQKISKVMKTAWSIKADNTQANAMNWEIKKLTWSECLKLAWSLIKKWSGVAGDILRAGVEIFRANGAGVMRSKGILNIRKTIS
jgi:hypothetical protein